MASDAKRIAKIGRLGEQLLQRLATEASLTVSKPEYDENGWDRILEFPANRLPNVFLDGQPSALKCLVQVKSSDDASPKVSMEVSNFEHLAKTPMPTFMFFVYFGNKDEPVTAHFSHFGPEWVGRTLQRIRTLEAKGSLDLHKHTMTYSATSDDLLPELNGKALTDAIINSAGNDADDYALRKVEILRTIGFGPDRGVANFTIKSTPEELSKALVGLTSVNIENGEMYQRRFGIDLKEREISTGTLTIKPRVAGRCTVTASPADFSRPFRIEADVILPAVKDLSPELMRSLIRNENIQIDCYNNEGKITFLVSDDQEYDLDILIGNLQFMLGASQSGSDITFSKDGTDFGGTKIQEHIEIPGSYPQLLQTLKVVKDALRIADIPGPHMITLAQLREQLDEIYWADIVVNRIDCTLSSKLDAGTSEVQTHEGTFSRPVIIKCGNKHHFLLFFWDATIVLGAKKIKAKISNRQFWDARTFNEDDSTEGIRATLNRFEMVGRKRRNNTLMSANVTFIDK